uniref:Uncharacterized protein n=1 Tax=Arundo donax TaxID=35708 RepID=A0A0A9E1G6_ARUDO
MKLVWMMVVPPQYLKVDLEGLSQRVRIQEKRHKLS